MGRRQSRSDRVGGDSKEAGRAIASSGRIPGTPGAPGSSTSPVPPAQSGAQVPFASSAPGPSTMAATRGHSCGGSPLCAESHRMVTRAGERRLHRRISVGTVSVEKEIDTLGLTDAMHIHDWLPHAAAKAFVDEADALLLLAQQQPLRGAGSRLSDQSLGWGRRPYRQSLHLKRWATRRAAHRQPGQPQLSRCRDT